MKGNIMNTIAINTQNPEAGVPPAPPVAHQREVLPQPTKCALYDIFTDEEIETMDWPEDIKRDQRRRNFCGSRFTILRRVESLGFVVFQENQKNGKVWVKGFSGKRMMFDFFYSFKTQEAANAYLDKRQAELEKCAARKAERKAEKAEKMAQPHKLKVGDVLKASWGYEQTNVDYYEVIKLSGKRTVTLRAIAQDSMDTGWQRGRCTPVKGHYIGEPLNRRVLESGDAVKIKSYMYASLKKPTVIEGVEVYASDHWTAYA
jgi:hypothetical protein